jgi:hypothetical protein
MNKRILELSMQAGYMPHWTTKTAREEHFDIEKFAELLVKECMTIGFNTVYKVDDDRNAVEVYQNIKEHFGVEE